MQIAASSASPSFPPTPLLLELRFGLSGHGPKNYVPAGFAFVVLRPYSALLPTVLPTVTVYAVTILPSISSCSKFVVSQLLKWLLQRNMCVTVHSPLVHSPSGCPYACLSVPLWPYSKFHALAFVCVRSCVTYTQRVRELVAKNYCTFVAFALLAGCRFAVAGFLLLVVSIYGKLLKLYGNLFASLSVCVYVRVSCVCVCVCCVSFILFRYAYLQLLLFFLYRQVCLFFTKYTHVCVCVRVCVRRCNPSSACHILLLSFPI